MTLYAVWRQVRESAKATKSMRDSILIQEAEFLQWVDIEDWKIESLTPIDDTAPADRADIQIRFSIVNNTVRPLSICDVEINVRPQVPGRDAPLVFKVLKERVFAEHEIAPKGRFPVHMNVVLNDPLEAIKYVQCELFITIDVAVSYKNALGKPDNRTFRRLAKCGPKFFNVQTGSWRAEEHSKGENTTQNPH